MSTKALHLNATSLAKLQHALLSWYDHNRRDLPWRTNRDPYRVWVSEIMLQQTRVAAVVEHYARFMRRFPTVRTLASARESSVLTIWSGLGYYHRARRMHQAAKVITRERKGSFPRTAEDWRELPGIGRYTAAAIASIGFGEAVAVLDGNVERVLHRMFGVAENREAVWLRAEILLSRQRPGDFNQAMMELGAMLCTPRTPQCLLCPLYRWCRSKGAEEAQPQPLRKRKHLYYALARRNKAVLLVQRPAHAGIMAGMWELPTVSEIVKNFAPVMKLRHSITDTDYAVAVVAVPPDHSACREAEGHWFTRKQWERLPLTGLTRKVLQKLQRASF